MNNYHIYIPEVEFKKEMSDEDYQKRLALIRSRSSGTGGVLKLKKPRIDKDDMTDNFMRFITSVVRSLKSGNTDYIFSEVQLVEILKYLPELRCKYIADEVWEVWI